MHFFNTHFVLPLAEPDLYAGLPKSLRRIRHFERMSPPQQRAAQHLRLQRMLTHAYANVPFYRKQFDDAGVHPSQMQPGQPIPIPVTTPETIREQSQSTLPTSYRQGNLSRFFSSDTTSPALTVPNDANGLRARAALNLHFNAWAGYRPGDSVMMLRDEDRDLMDQPNWRSRLYERVLMRRSNPPSGHVSQEPVEFFRICYEKRRPKVLYGPSATLADFASHLAARGMRHRPRVVIATDVPSDADRRHLDGTFSTRLFAHYSSRDIGLLAAECSDHEGVHFHPWGAHLEFEPIFDSPDGPVYRLLATDLLNYRLPLIRYDSGDYFTLAEQMCSCGRRFPLARKINMTRLSAASQNPSLPDPPLLPSVRGVRPLPKPGVRAS